ncbi:MAG: hypothetical protein H6702_14575 [Myxococcales bacterium]|nr:hypothetical protein [Myxococcales bacterium]
MRRTGWLLALGLLSGCGGAVVPVGVQDPRLPAAARRRVADAEDAVSVARARLAEARAEAAETARWRSRLQAEVTLGSATDALLAMAAARVALGQAEIDRGEAELAYARARLAQTYAEASVRHDLAVYELGPLTAASEGALAELQARRAATRDARLAAEQAAGTFWQAYGAHVRGGGDTRAYWLVGTAP